MKPGTEHNTTCWIHSSLLFFFLSVQTIIYSCEKGRRTIKRAFTVLKICISIFWCLKLNSLIKCQYLFTHFLLFPHSMRYVSNLNNNKQFIVFIFLSLFLWIFKMISEFISVWDKTYVLHAKIHNFNDHLPRLNSIISQPKFLPLILLWF